MTTTTRIASTLAVSFALVAIGCSSTQNAENGSGDGAGTGSAQNGGGRSTSGGEALASNCQVDSVYFGYDSSELDGRARSTLERNATCINQGQSRAQVTGMTDPRGTEEYNLALGDRRARTVTGYMANLGVDGGRVANRSMGEEMASGENETGWATDRRAQIELR